MVYDIININPVPGTGSRESSEKINISFSPVFFFLYSFNRHRLGCRRRSEQGVTYENQKTINDQDIEKENLLKQIQELKKNKNN